MGINGEAGAENSARFRIVIYGAVTRAPIAPPLIQQWKSDARICATTLRDTFLWRAGSLSRLNYRQYLDHRSINRGDQAISQATCKQLRAIKPDGIDIINVDWGELGKTLNADSPVDLILIAGSGYITLDKNNTLPDRINTDLTALAAIDTPMAFYGIGVNRLINCQNCEVDAPLAESDSAVLRRILARASLISVRDKASQQFLSRYATKPVHLIGDPAFFADRSNTVAVAAADPSDSNSPTIGINFPFHGPSANDRIKNDLPIYVKTLKQIQQRSNCRFNYFVHFGAERIIPKLLAASGVRAEVISGDPATLLEAYANLNVHIGGMLHSCILAASAGTPSIALAYDMKHFGFFEMLALEQYCYSAEPFTGDLIVAAVLDALNKEKILKAHIRTRREVLEKKAEGFLRNCIGLVTKEQSLAIQ
jgi:polysaccharide pyruvyl transferase WcaK-like protein